MSVFRHPSPTYTALLAALGLGAPGCLYSCFVAGTRVRVPGGTRSIESLRAGDPVLAFDPARGVVAERVVRTFHHRARPLLRVASDRGTTYTTAEHPYFTEHAGFVPALALSAGTRLRGFDVGSGRSGEEARVLAVAPLGARADVWNLSVSGAQTYFADDVLVHNKSYCERCSDSVCMGQDLDSDGVPWEEDCDDSTAGVGTCAPGQARAEVCAWEYRAHLGDAGIHDLGLRPLDGGNGDQGDGGPAGPEEDGGADGS